MGTPHADRLYKMESWRTSALEDSHRHLASVSQALTQIATGNREVAADLGLECATARAACASLDRLAGRMLTQADVLKQIVKSSTDVLHAGIDARNESVEIQAKLKRVNTFFKSMEPSGQAGGNASTTGSQSSGVTAAEVEAQRRAAHAEIDLLAKKSLSKLNDRTLAAIDALPPHGHADQGAAVQAGSTGRPSSGGQANRDLAAGPKAGSPTRSAAAWGASVDTSLGGPGRHAGLHDSLGVGASGGNGSAGGPVGGGASLQASHYAPSSSGAIASSGSSGSPAGVVGHSPAVHNPLASAAAITGGAGVAGYKAYQAARAARAVQTPAARASVVRAAGAAPSASSFLSTRGIMRGATTAARTPTASGRPAGAVRGGATGIARPASTSVSGRSAGIVRGATTAVRTPTASTSVSGRSAGIVRGATTAVRTPTTSAASAGQSGGRTPARGSGARVLTGGRTPAANGTGASRGAGSSSRGGLATRSASSVERTPTRQTSRGGATRTAAARGQTPTGRLSQSGTRQTEVGNAPRSGSREAEARTGSSSRALSSLTGRPDKKNTRRRNSAATQSVLPYEDDKTVTFLEAGRREENNDVQPR